MRTMIDADLAERAADGGKGGNGTERGSEKIAAKERLHGRGPVGRSKAGAEPLMIHKPDVGNKSNRSHSPREVCRNGVVLACEYACAMRTQLLKPLLAQFLCGECVCR